MASVVEQSGGRRKIQFAMMDGRRTSIALGKVARRQAESVRTHIELLIHAKATATAPPLETSRWMLTLPDALFARMAASGLAEPRHRSTLAAYLDDYIAQRSDVKESTRTIYRRARRLLVEYFGKDCELRTIKPGEADAWRHWLRKRLADNTVRRTCGLAKQFFSSAVRGELIERNVFEGLVSTVHGNPEKMYFVTPDETRRLIDACPDAQWRLLVALARYGGLRTPSEALRVRWEDVNWDSKHGCFIVHSPKTEHIPGKAYRSVPLFPELRPYLQDAFDLAQPGDVYCITRYPQNTPNLVTQLRRIIKRAGMVPWPKGWQNMRSSRQTELSDVFPSHVVTAWLGNSAKVAAMHYLQVTEDHVRKAVQNEVQNRVQNQVLSGHARNGTGRQEGNSPLSQVVVDAGFGCSVPLGAGYEIDITNGPGRT